MTPNPAKPGEVAIVVEASDADSGLNGAPVVTVQPVGGGVLTTAQATPFENPAGTFNYTFTVTSAMTCGAATVRASVSDMAGNPANDTDSFNIDPTGPSVTVATVTPDPAPAGPVTFVVNSSDVCSGLAGTPALDITLPGGSVVSATPTTSGGGVFNYEYIIAAGTPNGLATARATATDNANNVTVSSGKTFMIDTQAPILAIPDITQDGHSVDLAVPGSPEAYAGTVSVKVTASDTGSGFTPGSAPVLTAVDSLGAAITVAPVGGGSYGSPGFYYNLDITTALANGTATVTANVSDLAGNAATPAVGEFAINKNGIRVRLELQGAASITRPVTFIITTCSPAQSRTVTPKPNVTVDAVGQTSLAGVLLRAPDVWAGLLASGGPNPTFSLSAKEEHHTLRSLRTGLVLDAQGQANVTFLTGDKLLAGDFNNDNFVDVIDFSVFAANFNRPVGVPGFKDADVNGNGLNDSADFSAIVANFFTGGDAEDDCGMLDGIKSLTAASDEPLTQATRSLPAASLDSLSSAAADANGDGLVDVRDLRAFARQNGLHLAPATLSKLSSMEKSSGTRSATDLSRTTDRAEAPTSLNSLNDGR
jgi:hypothetical protein